MKEIKDQDILEAFKLGDKDSDDKILHGVMRKDGRIMVVFERKSDQGYSGFLSKSNFDLSNLSQVQRTYLENKGYTI